MRNNLEREEGEKLITVAVVTPRAPRVNHRTSLSRHCGRPDLIPHISHGPRRPWQAAPRLLPEYRWIGRQSGLVDGSSAQAPFAVSQI